MKYDKKALAFLAMHCNYPTNIVRLADAIRAIDIHAQQIIGIVQSGDKKADIIESIKKL